mmetsp:Transcript_27105/g.108548  ORF Transcript_27105/g.108548 Transcript_27105/m.108548 type:complete len:212 (-) Transcript_27105:407-1042(-)
MEDVIAPQHAHLVRRRSRRRARSRRSLSTHELVEADGARVGGLAGVAERFERAEMRFRVAERSCVAAVGAALGEGAGDGEAEDAGEAAEEEHRRHSVGEPLGEVWRAAGFERRDLVERLDERVGEASRAELGPQSVLDAARARVGEVRAPRRVARRHVRLAILCREQHQDARRARRVADAPRVVQAAREPLGRFAEATGVVVVVIVDANVP